MIDRRQNTLIGLFVLGGLVSLGVMIVKFGESRGLFGKRYMVSAKFDQITGIREGTDVNLAGVWAGSVSAVELADPSNPSEGVFVRMEVGKEFSVPLGSVASVVTPLMGQPNINIIPPPKATKPLLRDGTAVILGVVKNPLEAIIDPKFMSTMERTAEQIGELAKALTPAADAITGLLEQRTIQEVEGPKEEEQAKDLAANLYTAVERLHNVLKHIETVLGDPEVQSNLKSTLENFKTASEDAKAVVAGFKGVGDDVRAVFDKINDTVETANQQVKTLGQKLITNADKLARLLDYVVSAGKDLAEGEGTMGLMLRDPKFYDALLLTTQRMGVAASELQVLIKQWQDKGLLGIP